MGDAAGPSENLGQPGFAPGRMRALEADVRRRAKLLVDKNSPGTPMRYDSIWLSDHFTVQSIDYHYDDTPGALSDHAAVHAVITL